MLHLFHEMLGHVGQVTEFLEERIGHRYAEQFVVRFAAINHLEQADDPGFNETAGEGGLVDHHDDVQRVMILGEGLRDEAVVARIVASGVQVPVQLDQAGVFVHLEFVSPAFGNLDDGMDDVFLAAGGRNPFKSVQHGGPPF